MSVTAKTSFIYFSSPILKEKMYILVKHNLGSPFFIFFVSDKTKKLSFK